MDDAQLLTAYDNEHLADDPHLAGLRAVRDAMRALHQPVIEALELIAAPQRSDGSWNRDREACRQLAADALGGRTPMAGHCPYIRTRGTTHYCELAAAPIIAPEIIADKPQADEIERLRDEHLALRVAAQYLLQARDDYDGPRMEDAMDRIQGLMDKRGEKC